MRWIDAFIQHHVCSQNKIFKILGKKGYLSKYFTSKNPIANADLIANFSLSKLI
jgi:hypothetical protein